MSDTTSSKRRLTGSWQHLRISLSLIRQYREPIILIELLPVLTVQLGMLLDATNADLGRAVYLTGLLWLIVSTPAGVCLALRASRQQPVAISTLYSEGLRYFWRLLGAAVITTLLICVGLILLIIPGLFMIRRYTLTPYYIVDKDLGVLEAMRRSSADSRNTAGYIWGSLGVVLAVTITAMIAGLAFQFPPGLSGVITSIISLSCMFVLPLRYIELAKESAAPSSSDS